MKDSVSCPYCTDEPNVEKKYSRWYLLVEHVVESHPDSDPRILKELYEKLKAEK